MHRIAIAFEYSSVNGGEHSMLSVLSNRQSNYEVIAFAPADGELSRRLSTLDVDLAPIELTRCPSRTAKLDAISELCQQYAIDLLHGNSVTLGRLTGSLSQSSGLSTSCHIRDIMKFNPTGIAQLNANAMNIAVSIATKDFHIRQGLDPDRISTVYNGVDPNEFQERDRTGFLVKELGLNPSCTLLLSVGQICLRKGWDIVARAIVDLIRDFPSLYWIHAGERFSNKQESIEFDAALDRVFAKAKLSDRFVRLGTRPDIPQIMNEVDLLVHGAHQEPLGRVLLEAASCQLPIVATDVGGTREIIEHDKSGLLIPSGDVGAMKSSLRRVMTDPKLAAWLGKNARTRILNQFHARQSAVSIQELWMSLLD